MRNNRDKILYAIGVLISVLIFNSHASGQSRARIVNVDFFPKGSSLIIMYDIIKFKNDETFEVWVDVYTESGDKIRPVAVTGDVGSNIIGGEYKRIIWDMEADQAFLDEDIAVVVLAESEVYNKDKSTEKIKHEEQADATETVSKKTGKQGISVGGAIGLSVVLPGLGRRVATGKGAAYLWGVAGYGCLAGAYFMNNSAYNAYEDYKAATTTSERDDLFKKAKNFDTYSKVFVGAAATIWVVDLIITGVKAGKVRSANDQRLSFSAGYDPAMKQSFVGMQYRF